MPRASASHTSSTASGRITNCGSITPLMISVASTLRFSRVSATCTSAAGAPGSGTRTQMDATRISMPRRLGIAQAHFAGQGRSSSGGGGRGRSRSPERNSPVGETTW